MASRETQHNNLSRNAGNSFKEKLEFLKENKILIYKQMEFEANDPKTGDYYNDINNTFEEVDVDILSESEE